MVSRQSIYRRERYANDPEYRDRLLSGNRRFREAHKDEINARRRERYRTDPEYREKHRGHQGGRYGVSRDGFHALVAQQGGACAICGEKRGFGLNLDHCHSTEEVRGLLSPKCNVGLGMFGDDPHRMLVAIAYLEASRRDVTEPADVRATAAAIAKGLGRRLEAALRAQLALRRKFKRAFHSTSDSSKSGSRPPGSSRRSARRK
jgi:Recombination endonuclease VII